MVIQRLTGLVAVFLLLVTAARAGESMNRPQNPANPYFRITVLDSETGRGIPCVCLRSLNGVEYWTDSAGEIAFHEPGLMAITVFFHVESYGYSLMKPGPFDLAAVQVQTEPGGHVVLELRRENIAERIYRCTGQGIYRDSQLLGLPHPPVQDAAEIPVIGQDGGLMVPYKGRFIWSWGDSVGPEFPLGVFRGVGGASEFPETGGLDPDVGVRYAYFRDEDGHVRPMVDLEANVVWPMAPRVARDENGGEHLLMNYCLGPDLSGGGIVEFNDETQTFRRVGDLPPGDTAPYLGSASLPYRQDGREFFIFGLSWGAVRTPLDYASNVDATTWESFTCLKEGAGYQADPRETLDRDDQGRLRWGWKKGARVVPDAELPQLVQDGVIRPEERWYRPIDIATGRDMTIHDGTVTWNPYRRRWISLRPQLGGDSLLGEVFYFEGDTPLGPWIYGRKVVTHARGEKDSVGFYSVKQQPEFDKDDGKIIYFEGAFSRAFGSRQVPIPRYDYNELMYKLDLADPRLVLPVPVYAMTDDPADLRTLHDVDDSARVGRIVCLAPDRPGTGTVPVYSHVEDSGSRRLTLDPQAAPGARIAFFAQPPAESAVRKGLADATVPLFEYREVGAERRFYSTEAALERAGFARVDPPVCRVWPYPIEFNPFELTSDWEPVRMLRGRRLN